MFESLLKSLFGNNSPVKDIGKSNRCPSCCKILAKPPKRKAVCPFCGNEIFVRTKQNIFPAPLLTKKEAMAVDWLKKLRDFGLTENDYFTMERDLTKSFGKKPYSTDVIWGLFNKLILMNIKDLETLGFLHYSMALFLNQEGRNCFLELQESAKMELLSLKKDSIKKVKICTCKEASCDTCHGLEGTILSIKDALELMPVPCNQCTHELNKGSKGFCRCRYSAQFQ